MIVGFNVDSINAEKGSGSNKGSLQINYKPVIESVEEVTVNAFDEKVAKIEFTFSVNYDVGDTTTSSIEFAGNVLWKGNTDELIEEWEENESLPEKIRAPLMNDLYRKCISQSVGVADTLGLLPPIPTPRIDK